MNTEQDFLLSLLQDTSAPPEERYMFCRSKQLSLSTLHRPVYDWILDFYKQYKLFPTREVVMSKYPAVLLMEKVDLPFSYYKTQIVNETETKDVGLTLEKASIALKEQGPEVAVEIMLRGSNSHLASKQIEDFETVQTAFDSTWEEYLDDKINEKFFGLCTGIDEIDRAMKGILDEQIVAFMARPGNLKSMLATAIAVNCAKPQPKAKKWIPDGPVLLVSPEMSRKEFYERFYCNIGNLRLDDYMNGNLIQQDAEKIKAGLAELPHPIIVRTDIFDAAHLAAVCYKVRPIVCIVDGAYLLGRSKKPEDQSALLKSLKEMVANSSSPVHGMPMVCFSQLNRQKDVGFSDSWEQDPNTVITFERLAVKQQGQQSKTPQVGKEILTNQLEFSSVKVRRGKPFYKVKMWFDESTSQFRNGEIPQSVLAADNERKSATDEIPIPKINKPPGIENEVETLF